MRNSFYFGFAIGLVVCAIAYVLTNHTDLANRLMPSKPGGLYVIAVALNFVGVWAAYRNGYDRIGKGLVFVTFIGLLLAVFTKTIVI